MIFYIIVFVALGAAVAWVLAWIGLFLISWFRS